jgi:inosine-uridine nucleoside N-ribohydrolase
MGGGVTHRSPLPANLGTGKRCRAEQSHNVTCDVRATQIVFRLDPSINVLTNDVTTQHGGTDRRSRS